MPADCSLSHVNTKAKFQAEVTHKVLDQGHPWSLAPLPIKLLSLMDLWHTLAVKCDRNSRMRGAIVVPRSLEHEHLSAIDPSCSEDIRDSGMREMLC